MQIKADGCATLLKNDGYGRRYIIGCRAWFTYPDGYYRWSKALFSEEYQAIDWGEKVSERYNRMFGKDEVKDE